MPLLLLHIRQLQWSGEREAETLRASSTVTQPGRKAPDICLGQGSQAVRSYLALELLDSAQQLLPGSIRCLQLLEQGLAVGDQLQILRLETGQVLWREQAISNRIQLHR